MCTVKTIQCTYVYCKNNTKHALCCKFRKHQCFLWHDLCQWLLLGCFVFHSKDVNLWKNERILTLAPSPGSLAMLWSCWGRVVGLIFFSHKVSMKMNSEFFTTVLEFNPHSIILFTCIMYSTTQTTKLWCAYIDGLSWSNLQSIVGLAMV